MTVETTQHLGLKKPHADNSPRLTDVPNMASNLDKLDAELHARPKADALTALIEAAVTGFLAQAQIEALIKAGDDALHAKIMGGLTPEERDTISELATAFKAHEDSSDASLAAINAAIALRAKQADLSTANEAIAALQTLAGTLATGASVSALQDALDEKAPLEAPQFTGVPKVGEHAILHVGNLLELASNAAAPTQSSPTGSVTPDFEQEVNFQYSLTGNLTISNPDNVKQGVSGVIVLSTTEEKVVSWGGIWKFPEDVVPSVTGLTLVSFYAQSSSTILATAVVY